MSHLQRTHRINRKQAESAADEVSIWAYLSHGGKSSVITLSHGGNCTLSHGGNCTLIRVEYFTSRVNYANHGAGGKVQ
jgi:hypothetical protein